MHIFLCAEQTYTFWYKQNVLFLRALFVSFYLHVLHLMECSCTVLVIVVLLLLYPPYYVSLFASHPGFLSIVSARICRIVSSHVSLYARVILFFIPALVSQSLFALLSLLDGSHPKTFPNPLVLGRFIRVLLSRIIRSQLSTY